MCVCALKALLLSTSKSLRAKRRTGFPSSTRTNEPPKGDFRVSLDEQRTNDQRRGGGRGEQIASFFPLFAVSHTRVLFTRTLGTYGMKLSRERSRWLESAKRARARALIENYLLLPSSFFSSPFETIPTSFLIFVGDVRYACVYEWLQKASSVFLNEFAVVLPRAKKFHRARPLFSSSC